MDRAPCASSLRDSMRRTLPLLFLTLAATACASDPTQNTGVPLPALSVADVRAADGTTFRLRPNEVAASEDGSLLVTFPGIRADSRCPAEVTCVWAGDAEMRVGTAPDGGRWSWTILHTGVEPRAVVAGGHTVTLLDLEPAARESGPIAPGAYIAVLRITRTG
jgi:hypothetical protein